VIVAFPPGLDALYGRMMEQIRTSRHSQFCKDILTVASVVYRPIALEELTVFVDTPTRSSNNAKALTEIVGLCGSFLTLSGHSASFFHQYAKDFILEKVSREIFPTRTRSVHFHIFSRSVQALTRTLQRDIYNLGAPGIPISEVRQPDPDPLAKVRYSCVYWLDHLHGCDPTFTTTDDLQDGGSIDSFLRQYYLHWLEALSLLRSVPIRIPSMIMLEDLLQIRFVLLFGSVILRLFQGHTSEFVCLVHDQRQFIQYHKALCWNHGTAIVQRQAQGYAVALRPGDVT
jgi:hypothetical protein